MPLAEERTDALKDIGDGLAVALRERTREEVGVDGTAPARGTDVDV